MNFTLPMASSSEAIKPRQLLGVLRVARGLTWVEGWLEGGEPVVLEHVQEGLFGIQLACGEQFQETQKAHGLSGVIETEEEDLRILVQETW